MYNKSKLLALAGTTLALFAVSAPAHAQATRTWVSGVGDDLNPCSRTAPCKTFAGAISKTFINGEIDCLDPGGYGAVTITKSITIDCTGTFGSILASGTTGVTISIAVNANDPFRTVRLRGLSINGSGASGTIGTRTGVRGVRILDAAVVEIEDTVISDFVTNGIADSRTSTGGKLLIRNSVIRDVTGSGIGLAGANPNNVSIENVHSINNGIGVAAGTGNRVSIVRSVLSRNTTAGVEGDPGSQIGLENSLVSGNTTGLQSNGTMSLSNTSLFFNGTIITGATTSFGNNRILGGAPGTAPTVGAPTTDHGQL
jgi:Right handed beta helix region